MWDMRWKFSGLMAGLMLALAAVACAQAPSAPAPSSQAMAPLDETGLAGYLQWLHSLEQEVSLRREKSVAENFKLFPFGRDEVALVDTTAYRHLTIAKALAVLETQFSDPAQADDLSPLVALANARNYVNLTEFDSSLVWFDAAAAKDSGGDFNSEIRLESMAAAIAAGDSLRMAGEVVRLAGAGLDQAPETEIVLALRWCLVEANKAQLATLVDSLRIDTRQPTPPVRYWAARALERLDRPQALYLQLGRLVRNGGLSLGLTEAQRGWVITALADTSFRLGLADQARRLYSALAESPLEDLKLWASYQLAGMDLGAGDFLAAETGYSAVCDAKIATSWHDQACAMAKTAAELERIRREGEPYGTSRFYKP